MIGIVILVQAVLGGVQGSASEVAVRALIVSAGIPFILWLFFVVYLIFNPDFDGHEKRRKLSDDGN